ncbi:MAG: hypothetical protein R3C31_11270 [Hyphomonadaceae bacterium]
MALEFDTLPNDAKSGLQALAAAMWHDLKLRGYTVKIEPGDINLPGTPTFSAKRGHETLYVLVRHRLKRGEVQKWVLYGRSCSNDTRFAICTPHNSSILKRLDELQSDGVGVFKLGEDARFSVVLQTRDLAFNSPAPARSSLKRKIQKLLGEALDKYEKGDWRDGFETACVTLEHECRAYLLRNRRIRLGRVTYLDGTRAKTPTEIQIKKMTLGALKNVFCNMVTPTPTDSQLCAALGTLNKDRIGKVHTPMSKRTERALRTRVGRHFFLISNALSWIT